MDSFTNRLQSSSTETSAQMKITSGDPSLRALSATALRRSSLLATSTKHALLLDTRKQYASTITTQEEQNYKTKKIIIIKKNASAKLTVVDDYNL